MAGVRLHHATQRNVRFNVVEKENPYREPYQCTPPEFGGCGTLHLFKTHHLNIDETGSVTIGDVLYEKIKGILAVQGFSVSNVVEKPPALALGLGVPVPGSGAWGNIPIITGTE
jgi:hypothetical protein